MVRVFTVQIRDLGVKTLAAHVSLLAKVLYKNALFIVCIQYNQSTALFTLLLSVGLDGHESGLLSIPSQ